MTTITASFNNPQQLALTKMNNCANHKKEIGGITDMKVVAEMIGNLHYESFAELTKSLFKKIAVDSVKDDGGKRTKLGYQLRLAAYHIWCASEHIEKAWQISKPFMTEPIPITFSQALHATDEISSEQYETERQIIEEENERILRHGDQGPFENG